MPRTRSARILSSVVAASAAAVLLSASLSCSDEGSGPPVVATVHILFPAGPTAFQTLGRTLQFNGFANDASGGLVNGVTPTWTSSATGVAIVSAGGLVTAVANGTTEIRAVVGAIQSAPLTVTVAQVADTIVVTPGSVSFGAIGSTRQLTAAVRDSGGALVAGAPAPTWTISGLGTAASVSATGLATALAVGTTDSAVATLGALSTRAPISVTQVVASILVANTGRDTIETTGGTRTYAATVRDSQANTIPGQTPTWSSTNGAVASVSAGGLAAAIADGTTNVRATIGAIVGQRLLTVRRYAAVFDLAPLDATITTNGGVQPFTISALDSSTAALPATWLTRLSAVATVAPLTGAAVNVMATGNGMTFVLVSAGTRTDSAQVTVSGQTPPPLAAAVSVGSFFFRSVNNLTQNDAIDTVGVGGTVTWTWLATADHSVESTGAPSFPSGPIQNTGSLARTFNAAGTYQYICVLHSGMSGRVVVR